MTKFDVYPIGDLRIQVELQDWLQRAEPLASARVDVRVREGCVTLEGRVFCQRDAADLLQAAAEVNGVTDVRDDLRIEAPSAI